MVTKDSLTHWLESSKIGPVAIKAQISKLSAKRPEHTANINWRESYAKAYARWLEEYLPGWADWPEQEDYPRCQHGVMGPPVYCTLCLPRFVSKTPRLKPYKMDLNHPLRLGLFTFPTAGVLYLTKRGTIGQHYYPGDHEICPYNPGWRMRTAEAPGGYLRSGAKDGNAVRAARPGRMSGFLWDAEEETEGQTPELSQLTMLRPWEYDREDAKHFERKWFSPVVAPVLEHDTSPLDFAIAPAHRVRWSDLHEGEEPTIKYDDFKRGPKDGRVPEWKTSPWSITVPEEGCTDEDIERWRKKYWQKRTPYARHVRKLWAEGWRTERKMRDTAANLKMYDYGSGRINVSRMMATGQKEYRDAWLARSRACGIQHRQTVWPGGELGSISTLADDRCTAPAPGYYKNPQQRLGSSTGQGWVP